MDELNHIVVKVKELERELGRTPLRLEIQNSGISAYKVQKFGYEKILSLAGMNPHGAIQAKNKTKITNEIFNVNLENHLDNYEQEEFNSVQITSNILVAGDVHFCWEHKPTIEAFHKFNREVQPKYVVQVGDLYDMYAHSKFPRSQNLYTPREEHRLSREGAEAFFAQIKKDNPKAIIYNMMGNHDIRPVKRTLESMPQMEHFVEEYMARVMTFEGVNFVPDHREILTIEGVGFHHGYLGKLGDHRDGHLGNMVVGHTHRGGVAYRRIKGGTLWELNAGFMGDPEAKVMSYTPSKIQNYTLGFGYIDKYGPRFIHQ